MRLNRDGFTLVEVIIALALAGIAASFMIGTLVRQQRFYTSAAAILDTRAQLRDAADVLTTDIRGAATGLLGLPAMHDSAIEMYSTVATSVACTVQSAATIGLPPLSMESGTSLTSILVHPDTGDLALVFTFPPGRPDSGNWEALRIASFQPGAVASSCPSSTGFTTPRDEASGTGGFTVSLAGPPATPVNRGAPIHFVRRARYSLYRSSDNKWYLGYRRCALAGMSACAAIQPVSGPYERYSSSGPSGLSFRYFDVNGTPLGTGANSHRVARVDIVLRGKSSRSANLAGDTRSTYTDSVVVSVSPRNRTR
ncbi:MAG: prepilin-type N-terminal cleavage/methylation domain-containing protein [Gemmatimonadota bacterium]|nr:prepilin-type N-terminal cleavage/methylation domain-containing protein [Gemmatimonadota bacterium]